MRILHVTDTHLGAWLTVADAPEGWTRGDDHLAALRASLEPAFAGEADLVVHTGDVFDTGAPGRAAAEAVALLEEVARVVPVVVLAGNHDKKGLLPHLGRSRGRLRIVDRPERMEVAGLALACVPYQRLATTFAAAARHAWGHGADLMLAHQAFHGHRVPGFTFRVDAQRDTVGEAHLPPDVRHVLCGHLHFRQTVRVGGATVVCPGSTERTGFVEAGDPKGYAVWHFDAQVRCRFADVATRPMVVARQPSDLRAVEPGALVRAEPHLVDGARARGGWIVPGRVGKPLPPMRRRQRSQLGLF